MKRAVVLHGDIEEFRQQLDEVGVLKEVEGIRAYQMALVWLLYPRNDAAKVKVFKAGRLVVKGRTCLIVDPARHELRVKFHWVSFDVPNYDIRRVFADYGEVKDVAFDRWKVPGFEGVQSTTRSVRLVLRVEVTL